MSDADENDLFNIQVSDSEDDKVEKKSRRTGQTEDEFQAVKNTYRAKVENGNVSPFPLFFSRYRLQSSS
jgi:hypothetical protein